MAKFLVTSGSHFEPFTYDELAKPVIRTVEAHNATQDAIDVLGMEAAALEGYLSENEDDAQARALYNNYMTRLNALQNNLWENGYSARAKRDLSLAKTAYAQDIKGKLQNNIERRQAQSKAYWDMKHSNPDAVMGRDPGSFGLDNYINDPNFGNNWYTYSGKEFKKSVADEVKARASELKRTTDISKDPRLAGVLTRWEESGFTNAETLAAGFVVNDVINMSDDERAAYYKKNNTSPEIQILSESLVNQYNSTGAREADMEDSERGRLLNYGMSGWAEGVLGKSSKDFDDKVYDEQREMRKMAAQHNYAIKQMDHKFQLDKALAEATAKAQGKKGSASGSGKDTSYKPSVMGGTVSLTSPGFEKWAKSTESQAKHFTGGKTYKFVMPYEEDPRDASNEYEATEILYGSKTRDDLRKALGGYDIALDPKDNGEFTVRTTDGRTITYKAYKADGAEASKYGLSKYSDRVIIKDVKTKQVNEEMSRELSSYTSAFNSRVEKIKELNPDIEKMTIPPSKQKELRDDTNYPKLAPWKDFYNYKLGTETKGDYAISILAENTPAHDYARETLAGEFVSQFGRESDANGNVSKGSRFAIHVVGKGGMSMEEDTITNLGDVLGRNKDGSIRTDTLENVYATVNDFMGDKYIRFSSTLHPGVQYAVKPIAFGAALDNEYNEVEPLVREVMRGLNPDNVMRMSHDDAIRWSYAAYEILGSDPDNFPLVKMRNGEYRPATPYEIMNNNNFKEVVLNSIKNELTDIPLHAVREEIALRHEQHTGDTNANSAEYY